MTNDGTAGRLDPAEELGLRDLPVPIRPIGYVRTGYTDPDDAPIQSAHSRHESGTVFLFDEFAAGLADLAGFSFALVLSFMDRAPDPATVGAAALQPVPFLLRDTGRRRGVFATRYPVRPNRLALSLVRIEAVTGCSVVFTGVDLVDRTPVLDVKPWVTGFDLPPGCVVTEPIACGWYDELTSSPDLSPSAGPITLVASTLAGRGAFVARTVQLEGFGAADVSEVAIVDRHGVRAGGVLGGALDIALRAEASDGHEHERARLLHLDVDQSGANRAGLACGGRATVVLQPLDQVPGRWWRARDERRAIALVTRLGRHQPTGSVAVEEAPTDPLLHAPGVEDALELLRAQRSAARIVETPDGTVLVEAHLPTPRLCVVGSAALTDDIVAMGRTLGWDAHRVTDVDAALADVGELGPRDAVVVLDHDVRSTGPVLAAALDGSVGYVGALGSRRTQRRRVEYLGRLGLGATELDRLHGPTGLDLGAANRAETALSICAEIIRERSGRSGRSLRETTGSITR
jgi:xanthine dehydrogenase accessory factor